MRVFVVAAAFLAGCESLELEPIIVHEMPGVIDRKCSEFVGRLRDYDGCAIVGVTGGALAGACIVYLPRREFVTAVDYGRIRQHELAHCRGMKHGR